MHVHKLFCAVASFALGACSYTFNPDAPAVTLVGDEPALDSFPKINDAPTHGAELLVGTRGDYWATFQLPTQAWRAVELSPPYATEDLIADVVYPEYKAIYLLNAAPAPREGTILTIHELGSPATTQDDTYALPKGVPFISISEGGGGDIFIYWAKDPATTQYRIQRRRGGARLMPLPPGTTGTTPESAEFLFNYDGSRLYIYDGTQHLSIHSTNDATVDDDLGAFAPGFVLYDSIGLIITVDANGVRTLDIHTGKPVILDSEPATPGSYWFTSLVADGPDNILYITAEGLKGVPIDGSGPPVLVQAGAQQFLGIVGPANKRQLAYSASPSGQLENASDGWLQATADVPAWRFMERGRWLTYTGAHLGADKKPDPKMRYLEHSAQTGGVGQLMSVSLPSKSNPTPTPMQLAMNVPQYTDLDGQLGTKFGKGRILAIENQAFIGTQSRLVLIDENAATATWLCPSVTAYQLIPNSHDVLVDIITGATGYDVRRVPIPD